MLMKGRVVAILVAITGLILVAYGAIGYFVALPRFAALECDEAVRRLDRLDRALAEETKAIARITSDWGAWDETCKFITTHDEAFIRSTAPVQVFHDLRLNLIQFYDAQGKLVWGETRDWENGQPILIKGLPASGFPAHSRLVERESTTDVVSGMIRLGDRVMLIAASPIVTSKRDGPVLGSVVQGRWLSDSDQDHFQQLLSARCRLLPFDTKYLPSGVAATTIRGRSVFLDERNEYILSAYSSIAGIDGQPALLLRIDLPRQLMAEGRDLLGDSAWLILLTCLVAYTIAWWAFEQFVLRPVQRLVQHSLAIPSAKKTDVDRELSGSGSHNETYGRGLLEIVSDGIVLTDVATGRILDANRTFCELAGYRREELIDRRFEEVVVSRGDKHESGVQAVLRQGRQEFDVVDNGGVRIPVRLSAKVVTEGRRRLCVSAIHRIEQPIEMV